MALLNSCTPKNVYGPLNQTLFLGLTVKDFSATVGWNEQFTTLTVNLVTDSCAGSRDYMDDNYNWVVGETFANGDPGFNNAEVGSPAIFKIGETRDDDGNIIFEGFEFAGLIQSYNIQDNSSARNILTVNMISPGVVLEGTQVIVDGYADTTLGIKNIINAYGFLESLGQYETGFACPDLAGFGSPAGGFGFARKTDRGIPWDILKKAVQVLLGGRYTPGANAYAETPGVMTFRPGLSSGKYGSITSDKFIIDIEDVPIANDINYRISGPTLSVLELLSQVCSDAGCDYYVDFLPTKDSGTLGPLVNVIKIRVVSRVAQATDAALQDINDFIQSQSNLVSQQSLGQEMRAETTAGFIIGGQKEQLYEAYANLNPNNSNIFPYFGPSVSQAYWGSGTDPAQILLNDAQWYLTIDYSNLQLENTFTVPATQLDTETMLCAALGDFESFWNWIFTYGQGTQPWYYATVILNLAEETYIKDVKKGTMSGKPNQGKLVADALKASRTSSIYRDMNRIYDFLHQMAEEFYGKAFLVTVPFVCASTDTDTNKIVLSDEPADRGWREPGSTTSVVGGSVSNGQLMGLTVGSSATDFFADDVGKLEGFLRWNFAFQNFDNNVASTQDGFITVPNDSAAVSFYMKATINPQWYYFRRTASSALEIAALLTISTPVKLYNQLIDQNYIMHLGKNFRTGSLPSGLAAGLLNSVSPADAVDAASVPYSFPYGAVVPVKSNTRTYGPWYKGAPNSVGKVYTEKDDGFVPWEYGGASYMTQGAELRLQNKVTDMEKSERGSVTVAGYPEKQLGTALSDSPILLGSRSLSTYIANPYSYFYLNVGGLSTKVSQITDMSVSVSPSEITTTYTLSSFTPQFGRFTRGNEERLKQLAQQRFRTNKKLRASLFQGGSVNNFAQRIYQNFANSIGSTNLTHRSAPLFLVGKYFDDESNGMKRKQVASLSDGELSVFADYNNASLMSLDGIFRPVQNRNSTVSGIPIENAAGSPSYNYQRTFSESPAGPLDNYTGVIINTDYIRFLSNPSGTGLQNAQIFNLQGSGSILAHDIETVGRSGVDDFIKPNNAFDSGYLSIQDNTLIKYTDDYRYLAMRGPLVVHGWGYDLMGKPIPNEREDVPYYPPIGSPTSGSPFSGNHRKDYHNLSDYFYADWLGKPDTWPTAPVDLRYDRRRGVWTVPNDFRIYLANLESGISGVGATTTATVYNAEDLYDSSGYPLTGVDGLSTAQITVTMPLNESIDADRTLVYYSHESGQWWPLGFCCGGDGGGGGGSGTDGGNPPCSSCGGDCWWRCISDTWVKQGASNCYDVATNAESADCGCSPPTYPCVGTSDVFTSTACQSLGCVGGSDGGGTSADGGGGSGPIVYMSRETSDTQASQIYGEIVQDMYFYDDFTYGNSINPTYVVYTGVLADITGTGSVGFITDCAVYGTGNNLQCVNYDLINSGVYSKYCVSNMNNTYALPSGTKVDTQFDAALQCYRIISYKLPNNGCREVTSSESLYFYPKVMADASAGQVVLDLPLSTATGIAGIEFYIKKIDSSSNQVIISGTGSDLIDGQSTYTMNNQYEAIKIINCGSGTWFVL